MSQTMDHLLARVKTPLTPDATPATLDIEGLVADVEKTAASKAVDAYRARQEKLAAVRGQATGHAMVHELLKVSLAITAGVCWRCKTSKPDPASAYARCARCDGEQT